MSGSPHDRADTLAATVQAYIHQTLPVIWKKAKRTRRVVLDTEAENALSELVALARDGADAEKRAADAHEVMVRVYERAERAEADNAQLRAAIEDYILWEPGRAGHAEAHRKLVAALAGRQADK